MDGCKFSYRFNQFKLALFAKPSQNNLKYAENILNSKQFELFLKLQDSEQVHAIEVCRQAESQGLHQPDLLTAALLHDIGKILYPIRLWERVLIVIAKKFSSKKVEKWGQGKPEGFLRAFVIGEQHPDWGAELVQKVDTSPLAVSLIRRHQEENFNEIETEEERLLEILQKIDNIN